MIQFIVGVFCILAVFLLKDEDTTPSRPTTYPRLDPMVILALEELDDEDD